MPDLLERIAQIHAPSRDAILRILKPLTANPRAKLVVENLSDGLSENGLAALFHPAGGGTVVLKGEAGSGKTELLARRIIFLLLLAIPPARMLHVTRSRSDLTRISDRVSGAISRIAESGTDAATRAWLEELGRSVIGVQFRSFASLAIAFLGDLSRGSREARRAGELLARRPIDDAERDELLGRIIASEALDVTPKEAAARAARVKHALGERARRLAESGEEDLGIAFAAYERILAERNLRDADDPLRLAAEIAISDPDAAAEWGGRHAAIFCDRYEDVSDAEDLFLHAIAKGNASLMIAGDENSGIYEWRGGRSSSIRDLAGRPGTRAYLTLAGGRRTPPKRIVLAETENEAAETGFVAEAALKRRESDPATRIAVIARSRRRLFLLERHLAAMGAPCRPPGEEDRSREWRLLMTTSAFLAADLVASRTRPGSRSWPEVARENLFRESLRMITARLGEKEPGPREYGGLLDRLDEPGGEDSRALAILRGCREYFVRDYPRGPASILGGLIDRLAVGDSEDVAETTATFTGSVRADGDPTRLFDAILAELAGAERHASHGAGIELLTIHAAKGAEFDSVFLLGCEEGTLPFGRAESREELELEERLFRIATTRATSELTLTRTRRDPAGEKRRPSRFLGLIPAERRIEIRP